jgi:polyhydroxyalkanoate synthase
VESNESLARKYQEELNSAIKRYSKALGYVDSPPDVPVAQTPKEVIWTRNKAKLYHYLPIGPRRYREPILFIYSLMNKAFILDIRPGSSMIEFLVRQGYDVYLLDWGIPGPEDAHTSIEDYVFDYMPRAIKHTLRQADTDQLSLIGYCLGGVLSFCYTATHPITPVKNLTTFAIPLDFSQQQLFNEWLNPKNINLNLLLNAYGNIPGQFLDFSMRLQDPVAGFVSSYLGILDKVLDDRAVESWMSMQKWMRETIPFAGTAFKQCAEEMWFKNKLVRNQFMLRGQPVDFSNIKMSYLNVLADRDQIVLMSQSDMALGLVSSQDKEQIVVPGGHIGLAVGRTAVKGLWPALDKWLSARSESYP